MRRRRLLQGLGWSLAGIPVMSGLRPRPSRAAGGTGVAKRLAIFFSPNGTVHSHWRPTGSGTDYAFGAGTVLESLDTFRDRMVVCDGIDFVGTSNHEGGMSAMLTGQGDASSPTGGMSLDQYVASQLDAPTKFASLELGVLTSPWGGTSQTRMSYSAPATFVTPDDDPANVFDRMFADLAGGDEAVERLKARRTRVVDLLVGEVGRMKSQVGGAQRAKLDAHLEALAKLEQGITSGVSCEAPPTPAAISHLSNDAFPDTGRQHMDLMTMALMCDMTRVASIQWSHTVSPVVFTWLGLSEAHHSLSHIDDSNAAGVGQFIDCERWFADQFAYLLGQLDSIPDPDSDGTLLDTTIVLWCKELGDGRLHDCLSVPFVVAGATDCFGPGRYADFGGAPHNQLLVSICQAMGLTNDTFGDPSHGQGPLPGLLA